MRGRILAISQKVIFGGEGGIRTLDSREAILDFESSAFDHSATSPWVDRQQDTIDLRSLSQAEATSKTLATRTLLPSHF